MAIEYVPYSGPIVTRDQARALGLKRYFNGRPCRKGHLSEKYTSYEGCVFCALSKESAKYDAWREAKPKTLMCPDCGLEKPAIEFGKTKKSARCKSCAKAHNKANHRERGRVYRENNREKTKAASKRSFEKKKEQYRQKDKEYYQNNREILLAKGREHYLKNKGKVYKRWRVWYDKNRDRILEYSRNHRKDNLEIISEYGKQWKKNNRARSTATQIKREAIKIKATPPWADFDKIRWFYEEAARLTKETGIKYQVDHVIPLRSKIVYGFHVETNLQVLTASENRRKGNNLPF